MKRYVLLLSLFPLYSVKEIPLTGSRHVRCTFDDLGQNIYIEETDAQKIVSLCDGKTTPLPRPKLGSKACVVRLPERLVHVNKFCGIEHDLRGDYAIVRYANGKFAEKLSVPDVRRINRSLSGKLLALADKDGRLYLYDGVDQDLRSSSDQGGHPVSNMSFTCDEQYLVCNRVKTVGDDEAHSRIEVYDIRTGLHEAVSRFDRVLSRVCCSSINPQEFIVMNEKQIARHSILDPHVETEIVKLSLQTWFNPIFSKAGNLFVANNGFPEGVLEITPKNGFLFHKGYSMVYSHCDNDLLLVRGEEKNYHWKHPDSGEQGSSVENAPVAYHAATKQIVLKTPDSKKLLVETLGE